MADRLTWVQYQLRELCRSTPLELLLLLYSGNKTLSLSLQSFLDISVRLCAILNNTTKLYEIFHKLYDNAKSLLFISSTFVSLC